MREGRRLSAIRVRCIRAPQRTKIGYHYHLGVLDTGTGELIADLAAEGAALDKSQVVGIRGRRPAAIVLRRCNCMKTTLNIDDTVMAEIKREAAGQGRCMPELVETVLRLLLIHSHERAPRLAVPGRCNVTATSP